MQRKLFQFGILCRKSNAILLQKQNRAGYSCTLIAINERMVVDKGFHQRSRLLEEHPVQWWCYRHQRVAALLYGFNRHRRQQRILYRVRYAYLAEYARRLHQRQPLLVSR